MGQSYRTELLTYGIWHYLWVDSVRIELDYWTPCWYPRFTWCWQWGQGTSPNVGIGKLKRLKTLEILAKSHCDLPQLQSKPPQNLMASNSNHLLLPMILWVDQAVEWPRMALFSWAVCNLHIGLPQFFTCLSNLQQASSGLFILQIVIDWKYGHKFFLFLYLSPWNGMLQILLTTDTWTSSAEISWNNPDQRNWPKQSQEIINVYCFKSPIFEMVWFEAKAAHVNVICKVTGNGKQNRPCINDQE